MCGILAVFSSGGQVTLTDAQVERMRDTMAHRGPDGAGLWRSKDHVAALAHRRLAVIDPTPDGAQPMVTTNGRWAITYNGELYNDTAIRAELAGTGVRFRTASDTETVLAAVAAWGEGAFLRLRGMYAVVAYDTRERRALVARDPLGIKPLYWCSTGGDAPTFVLASEPQAILAHREISAAPDLVTVSSYLTTIRTTLGSRTLFEGVRVVRPGEVMEIDLNSGRARTLERWRSVQVRPELGQRAAELFGEVLRESVACHFRADVPVCSLLSGGIDSTVIAACAAGAGLAANGPVRTYCSGFDDGSAEADLLCARRAAAELGTRHTQVPVTEQLFLERWMEMVDRLGTPLSTPNEVAIREVARRLRADGQVVALSGEGADELLAGYDLIVATAANFEQSVAGADPDTLAARRALLHIDTNAWTPMASKPDLFIEEVWRACEDDVVMRAELAAEFAELAASAGPAASGLDVHLRYLRRVNLAGLLQRLDTSTMLEGVEGRTPFADVRVAEFAESLPASAKFVPPVNGLPAGTKLPLRAAFRGTVPEWVLTRPKASFPLPFAGWLGGLGEVLRQSEFAAAVFAPGAIEAVAQQPAALWRLAWPMLNLAIWGDRWWGSGRSVPVDREEIAAA